MSTPAYEQRPGIKTIQAAGKWIFIDAGAVLLLIIIIHTIIFLFCSTNSWGSCQGWEWNGGIQVCDDPGPPYNGLVTNVLSYLPFTVVFGALTLVGGAVWSLSTRAASLRTNRAAHQLPIDQTRILETSEARGECFNLMSTWVTEEVFRGHTQPMVHIRYLSENEFALGVPEHEIVVRPADIDFVCTDSATQIRFPRRDRSGMGDKVTIIGRELPAELLGLVET